MPSYVDQLNLNGNVGDLVGCDGCTYEGENLQTKFASEIASYNSAWDWILARITNGNFSKIHVGDYIPVSCTNGNTFMARIAGINTYKGVGDTAIGNHIDFISATLWPTPFKMNLVDLNNGTSTTYPWPWTVSNGYYFLNSLSGNVQGGTNANPASQAVDYTQGGIYYYLPYALKSVIVDKYMAMPKRYLTTGKVANDNGWGWANAGKIWLPTEVELTGASVWGGAKYAAAGSIQYPLFASRGLNRTTNRYAFWTCTPLDGNSTHFVKVNAGSAGSVAYAAASSDLYAPVCFRVAASNASGSSHTMDAASLTLERLSIATLAETIAYLES